ncbi:hypothetical protein M3J09_002785 [Ascochyta lentis]
MSGHQETTTKINGILEKVTLDRIVIVRGFIRPYTAAGQRTFVKGTGSYFVIVIAMPPLKVVYKDVYVAVMLCSGSALSLQGAMLFSITKNMMG